LAVALGGKNGVRIYTARTFRLKAEDKKYGNDCYWAVFSRNGRLATVSYDGFVRLYDRDFRLVEKVIASGGHEPFSVAFAPDGEKIAVGFNNSAKINILSGRNLSFLYAPDVRGINNGDISSVAWSADGNLLSAGGSYDDGTGMNPIRRWEQAGRGAFKDMPASGNTLMHILPLKNGETVFAASDPSWGVLNRQGQKRLFVSGVAPDHRNIAQGGLLVSLNGGRVSFGASQWGERQAVFDLASRTLTLSEGKMSAGLSRQRFP
jgi:WD40 repeat protein